MQKRRRPQKGTIWKKGGWWILRYRQTVFVDGELLTVYRSKQLAPIDNPKLRKPPENVLDAAKAILEPINQGKMPPQSTTTLGDFVEHVFLPYCERKKRASTQRNYRNQWKQYLQQRCSNWWLREVRTHQLINMLDDIAGEGKLSSGTLRHLKALLTGVFTFARAQGFYDGAHPLTGQRHTWPEASKGDETYAYTLEEIEQILALLDEPAATAVAVAAYSGLRRGEICGLLWENYSKNQATLTITRSIWNGVVSDPKTESSQAPVPVIKPLSERLELHRFRSGNPATGPIFRTTNPDTGEVVPLNFDNLTKRQIVAALNRCIHCEMSEDEHKAAAKRKRWKKPDHAYERDSALPQWHGWHAFRRGLATNLYRLGATDKSVQAILRHSHVTVTREHYIKAVSADVTAAMKQLESNIGLTGLNAPFNAPHS